VGIYIYIYTYIIYVYSTYIYIPNPLSLLLKFYDAPAFDADLSGWDVSGVQSFRKVRVSIVVQYEVSVVWQLHLILVCLYLI